MNPLVDGINEAFATACGTCAGTVESPMHRALFISGVIYALEHAKTEDTQTINAAPDNK